MSKRIIKVQLTEQSIDNAIKELEDYKKWLKEKTQEFVKALADEGMQISRAKFESATYDGTLSMRSHAFVFNGGLEIRAGTSTFSDGSDAFKVFNLSHVTSGGHMVFAKDGANAQRQL